MEATKMIESLASLRAGFEKPPTDMELIRRSLAAQAARATGAEMPPLLNDNQRKVFADKIDMVSDFLATEDGADAVELLVGAFEAFAAARAAPAEVETEATLMEDAG